MKLSIFNKVNFKFLHIALIVLGCLFISLSAFHSGLWFDESYSVGMANHTFKDIWIIGGNDVHPVFYYCALHVLNLIFGNNIIVYRLFSVFCVTVLGIIGFTHIRKDFGEKVGFLFSFLVFFFPVNLVYSGEIRMYSFAMLLVTLTAIYAYRIYCSSSVVSFHCTEDKCSLIHSPRFNLMYWIIFAVCSLASAYTHYYALMASGFINLFLFIAFILKSVKRFKANISTESFSDSNKFFAFFKSLLHDKNMIAFLVSAIIQIALYIPWILSLFTQMKQVSKGFWIGFHFPDTIIELFNFQFTGNLGDSNFISFPVAIVWSLAVTCYMIFLYLPVNVKNWFLRFKSSDLLQSKHSTKEVMKPAVLALKLFLSVAIAATIITIVWKPILYARYMLCPMGLFIFFLAYSMEKKGFKSFNLLLCITSMFICLYVNINFINTNYDECNDRPISFVRESIQSDDIILLNNWLNGFVIPTNFPENISYFYDEENWNCGEAYKAFSDDFRTVYDLSFLDDFSGRVWVTNDDILNLIKDNYDVNLIKHESFNTKYKNYDYSISLIELKNN